MIIVSCSWNNCETQVRRLWESISTALRMRLAISDSTLPSPVLIPSIVHRICFQNISPIYSSSVITIKVSLHFQKLSFQHTRAVITLLPVAFPGSLAPGVELKLLAMVPKVLMISHYLPSCIFNHSTNPYFPYSFLKQPWKVVSINHLCFTDTENGTDRNHLSAYSLDALIWKPSLTPKPKFFDCKAITTSWKLPEMRVSG